MTAANLVERPALVRVAAVLERLARLLADGSLTVNVARTYALTEASDAQRDVTAGGYVGKLVITP